MSSSGATVAGLSGRGSISAIIPTIGRAESLAKLLESLASQSMKPNEVIVADGSSSNEVRDVVSETRWAASGLRVTRLLVQPPNAVGQREAAIAASIGSYLLLLDDDVVLERDCVQQMMTAFTEDSRLVGVFADFNNQSWPMPTRAWRFYLRFVLGMEEGAWQGRVVGPLLRFGYNPTPRHVMPLEWLGTGNTMVRRAAYDQVNGFSKFFLHRCTMNEDVDLGLKLSRVGTIAFCPTARLGHFHAPGGRVSPAMAAEDDLHNRYRIMRLTQGRSALDAFGLVTLYFAIETTSNFCGCLSRLQVEGLGARLVGRLRALARIVSHPSSSLVS